MQKIEPQVDENFESLDGETRQVVALANLDSGVRQNMHRYEIGVSRADHRALTTLRQLQAARKRGEEQNGSPLAPSQAEPPRTDRNEIIERIPTRRRKRTTKEAGTSRNPAV
jgi:hypothetical protein